MEEGDVTMMVSDISYTDLLSDEKNKLSLISKDNWSQGKDLLPSHHEPWFTDGSKSQHKTGAGVYSV